jgi:hypothetical protein
MANNELHAAVLSVPESATIFRMPLSAEERLIPIRVKIKRAKKHLSELEAAAEKYQDSYTHVADENSKIAQGEPRLKKLPIIHFDMLAIAGDVLQNLRSALDHVMYHLALVANPNAREATLRQISFPIGKSAGDYKSNPRGRIKGIIEPRAMQFIDGLKPYKGGSDLLWRLHETNNIDKHRKLISIGTEILCEGEGFDGHYLLKADNPSFATVDISEGVKNTKITGFRSLMHLQTARSEALIPTLREMVEFVENLISDFSPLLE